MQGLLVDGMGADEEEDDLADVLLGQFMDRHDSAGSAKGKAPRMPDKHIARIQKSYEGIGSLIDDESF